MLYSVVENGFLKVCSFIILLQPKAKLNTNKTSFMETNTSFSRNKINFENAQFFDDVIPCRFQICAKYEKQMNLSTFFLFNSVKN